jgi:hypothetical protein
MEARDSMRRWLIAILMTTAGLTDAAAQSCTPYPETFAQGFYRSSYSFFNESPEQVSTVVSPGLLSKLQSERDCVVKQGHCHLQYDPWLGTQDGSVGSPLQFQRESQDARSAVVLMSYPAATAGAPAKSVRLKLRKAADSACWQLDDFITPTGEALSTILGSSGGGSGP